MLFCLDAKFHTLLKWINSNNRCKAPQQHLPWRIHLMGTHSPFYRAYDLRVNDNQTQALDFFYHQQLLPFQHYSYLRILTILMALTTTPHQLFCISRFQEGSDISICSKELWSCSALLFCWNLNSEFLNDRDMFCHLCGSLSTISDTGPQ